jgi:hypothetical protein
MTQDLEKKFFERFKFFHPEKSLMESLMVFGFECQDGWFDLIWKLCEDIEKVGVKEDFQVLQVKEKFGGLRFYCSSAPDEVWDLITVAEDISEKTCEICGKEGELRSRNRWLKTLCLKHAKELEYSLISVGGSTKFEPIGE